jgi:putative spermidine/putrescine transport system substrate-binding protein
MSPRRKWLLSAVLSAAFACAAGISPTQAEDSNALYKGYSGQDFIYNGAGDSGTLKDGLMNTVLGAFAKKTGINMLFDAFCCGVAKLQAQQDSGNVTWSVTQFSTMADLRLAEQQDMLVKIDRSIVPLGDLEDGSYDDYAIYAYPYAAVIAWNTGKWPLSGKHPQKVDDIFDTAAFPGKRCLYKYPQFGGTLEAALLASGVAPDKLYPLDISRAFKALDAIRSDIVWWNSGSQGVQQLVSGACDIAIVWNGPMATTIRSNGGPFAIAWGHAVWDYTPVSIPKGTKNENAAQALLRLMVTDRSLQEEFVKQTSYILMPLKAQVGIPADVQPWALIGTNRANAILEDTSYYTANITTLLQKFNGWVVSGR